MAAQNIAMQCFVKICTQFGPLLLVSSRCSDSCMNLYVHVCTYILCT